MVTLDKYKEEIDKIIEISKTSTDENSILYDFKIEDKKIKLVVTVVNLEGEKEVKIESEYTYNKNFIEEFFKPLLTKFIENNVIVSSDVVDMNYDNVVTYRIVSLKNDLLTVDGLGFEDTNKICDLIDHIKGVDKEYFSQSDLNSIGKTDIYMMIFMIILGLVIAALIIRFI